MHQLLNEILRRRVLRAAGSYLVFAWIVTQVAAVIFPSIGLGLNAQRVVLIALTIGFPATIFFSWFFEITPDGIKREKPTSKQRSKTGKRIDAVVALCLIVISGFFLWDITVRAPDRAQTRLTTANQSAEILPHSIAILPFSALNAGTRSHQLVNGFSEEIINSLSNYEDIKVVGRTSSFYFKDKPHDIRQVGQRLGVALILEGSIQIENEMAKITANLVDSRNGFQLWSQSYESPVADLLQIQEMISFAIYRKITHHAPDPGRGAAYSLTDISFENSPFYTDYLHALSLYRSGALENILEAEASLQRITKLEPENTAAYILLAKVMVQRWHEGGYKDLSTYDTVETVARRATVLAPTSADAYYALAQTYLIRNGTGDISALDQYNTYLRKAYQLDPNNLDVLLAIAYNDLFGHDKTKSIFKKLLATDPLNPDALYGMAALLIEDKKWDEARASLNAAIKIHPSHPDFPEALARMEEHLGHLDLAAINMQQAVQFGGGWHRQLLASYCASMGDLECARTALNVKGDAKLQARLAMLEGDNDKARRLFTFSFHASIVAGKQGDWNGAAEYLYNDFPQWIEVTTPPDPTDLEDGYLWTARVLKGIGKTDLANIHAQAIIDRYLKADDGALERHINRNILAGAYAILGDEEAAIDQLELSVNAGFRNLWKTVRWNNFEWPPDQHPVFDSLWENQRFIQLMEQVRQDNQRQLESWQAFQQEQNKARADQSP
ncbi:MAG: tetratricopeptide repeat protein [bacterium]